MKSGRLPPDQVRSYRRSDCAAFLKTAERYGGYSNMAGGFPLTVNGVDIRTSEALYQACRFPHEPRIQEQVLAEKSPMQAKSVAHANLASTRADWHDVNLRVMRWCLAVKLAQHPDTFGALLAASGDLPIVEISYRDPFWGASPDGAQLVGVNALGRLLMALRQAWSLQPDELFPVKPLTKCAASPVVHGGEG